MTNLLMLAASGIQLAPVKPNTSGPGYHEILVLIDVIAGLVIAAALGVLIWGAGERMFGGNVGNQIMADKGGSRMTRAFVTVVLVMAGAVFINFAIKAGQAA